MLDIKQINFKQIGLTLLDNWRIFAFVVLPVTLVAVIYCALAKPIYMASSLINPPKISDSGSGLNQSIFQFGPRNDGEIAISIIKSRTVAEMVVKDLNLIKYYKVKTVRQARGALLGSVMPVIDGKTGFINLQVFDKSPQMASDIANQYTTAIGQFISDLGLSKASQRRVFFEKALVSAKADLTKSESKLKDFNNQNGIIASNQMQVITGLATQLQAQLVAAQLQLQAMQHSMTADNPDYKNLQSQIASIKARLNAISGTNVNDSIPVPANLAPELGQQYLNLVRDYTFRTELYQLLTRQYEYSKLDEASDKSPIVVQVIDNAEPPLGPAKPKKLMIISSAFVFSLMLCLIYILIKNREKFVTK